MAPWLVVLAVLAALPLVARAQKPVAQTEAVDLTTKIEAIDKTDRFVTLKDEDGEMETIYCGPEVKRFDELKVGDTVTFRYYESIAHAIRKPGQPSGLPAETGPAVTRSQGARPGGTIAQQETAMATVKAIDMKVPSVTVLTEDGRTVSLRLEARWTPTSIKPDPEGYWCDPYWGCTTIGEVEFSNQYELSGGIITRF